MSKKKHSRGKRNQDSRGKSVLFRLARLILYGILNGARRMGVKSAPELRSVKYIARKNFQLGLKLLKKNRIFDAKLRFFLVHRINPNIALNHYCLAYIYFIKNRSGKALFHLKRAVDLRNGHFPRAEKLLKRIVNNNPNLRKS